MILNRIKVDPAIMTGRPCIRGTRVTVGTVIGLLAAGCSIEEILADYPYIQRADILECLSWAAYRTEEQEVVIQA
jgi:uncharacterized protein (DUF433 family)